jgi:DMSO reductase family type II enzyme chaperone
MMDENQMSEIDTALCRATLYSALAVGFRRLAEATIARFASEEDLAALADAASFLDRGGGSELLAAVRKLAAAKSGSFQTMSDRFDRLFGHTARGGVPPYETEYGAEALFQQPQEMGDLMGFYAAFGLTLNSAEHERPDHIGCECEFASYLALKEAYALEHGETAMLEETRKAMRLFLRDHLGHFAPAFTRKLAQEAGAHFYGALADLCLRLVTLDCARFGVPSGPVSLSLRPAIDDRVPMACGSGTECMAMPGAAAPGDLDE